MQNQTKPLIIALDQALAAIQKILTGAGGVLSSVKVPLIGVKLARALKTGGEFIAKFRTGLLNDIKTKLLAEIDRKLAALAK